MTSASSSLSAKCNVSARLNSASAPPSAAGEASDCARRGCRSRDLPFAPAPNNRSKIARKNPADLCVAIIHLPDFFSAICSITSYVHASTKLVSHPASRNTHLNVFARCAFLYQFIRYLRENADARDCTASRVLFNRDGEILLPPTVADGGKRPSKSCARARAKASTSSVLNQFDRKIEPPIPFMAKEFQRLSNDFKVT